MPTLSWAQAVVVIALLATACVLGVVHPEQYKEAIFVVLGSGAPIALGALRPKPRPPS